MNNILSLKETIDNMMNCLERAQERLLELGEVSPEVPYITDDMLLVDDLSESIEACSSLYDIINSAMVFAVYAGEQNAIMWQAGKDDPFGFGPDSFEMRDIYWNWAQELGPEVWTQSNFYEALEDFFHNKMNEIIFELDFSGLSAVLKDFGTYDEVITDNWCITRLEGKNGFEIYYQGNLVAQQINGMYKEFHLSDSAQKILHKILCKELDEFEKNEESKFHKQVLTAKTTATNHKTGDNIINREKQL